MKATIKNFMGCESAEIEASKIALLLGLNGQGKTSSLLPIAAALRGGVPLGLPKTKAGMLVKLGAGSGSIVLENDTSKVEVSWPKCERRADGADAPEASDIAVGYLKFANLPDRERIELLRSILECEPTEDDLRTALTDKQLSEKIHQAVWHNIGVDGWDASLERAKEKGRSLKSQWALNAGEAYGEKKGANWYPVGWENDIETSSAETLEAEVSGARAELEFKIANQAVSADELLRWKDEAEKIDEAVKIIEDLKKQYADCDKALKDAEKNRKSLPELPKYDLVCPHCGKPVAYQFGKIEAISQTLSAEEREALDQKVLDADNAVSKARREKENLANKLGSVRATKENAEAALQKYNSKKDLTVSVEDVDKSREEVRKAEARLLAFNKYKEGLRIHNGIIENQKIIDVLDPSGIRRQALERGLSSFNDSLSSICKKGGWADVTINGDMTVDYAGRPYVICSESEKFRASVTLQVAIADQDGSAAVVIDAADILDNKGRQGLLKILAKQPFYSFVGMMVSRPDAVPCLKKLGIGKKYWIEQGNCEEVYNG